MIVIVHCTKKIRRLSKSGSTNTLSISMLELKLAFVRDEEKDKCNFTSKTASF